MIIGWFGEKSGRPYVKCRLAIPRLGIVEDIVLCVDTGSDKTSLLPVDCRALGLDRRTPQRSISFSGVGGEVDAGIEMAWVALEDSDGLVAFNVEIALVSIPPEAPLRPLPSLLGRDILHRLRIEYQFSARRLEMEVESADVFTAITGSIQPPIRWAD